MTDRIQKFLGKLQEKERQEIEKLIEKIILGDLYGLDVKTLQGSKDMYRARRAIYELSIVSPITVFSLLQLNDGRRIRININLNIPR